MHEKSILRAADVCSILNVSMPTLYRWQRCGLFPKSIKYGPNCSGWERQTVDAFIAEKKSASQQVAK